MPSAPDLNAPLPDSESGIDDLRNHYRPERVRVLLVGESSPAGATHFYRANSNLFHATRDGFQQALDYTEVPDKTEFLGFFHDNGWWLVDLADRPMNRLSRSQRRRVAKAGVPHLTKTIDEACPELVIAVGETYVETPTRVAVRRARHEPRATVALPFPLYKGRQEYVEGIALAIRSISDLGE